MSESKYRITYILELCLWSQHNAGWRLPQKLLLSSISSLDNKYIGSNFYNQQSLLSERKILFVDESFPFINTDIFLSEMHQR